MKSKNRLITCVLIVAMLISNIFLDEVSPLTMTAHAAWDGTVAEEFHNGDGTKESPYIIGDESEFAYFGSLLSQGVDFADTYFELEGDIDISGQDWSASSSTFSGELCGNGHTIITNARLFGAIGTNGKLTLLKIKNTNKTLCCVICSTNKGVIESCGIVSNVASGKVYKKGLACEYNYGSFVNSYVIGRAAGNNSYIAAIAAENRGNIDNVYTAVSNGITQSGRYAGSDYDPIALSSTGTITNAYALYGTSPYCVIMDENSIKSLEFIDKLNKLNPSKIAIWVADSDNANEGYPTLVKSEKSLIECYLSCSNASVFTYHTEVLNTQILTSEDSVCDIYYTLDGSNPITSDTTQLYDGQEITLTGDVVISMVACENGKYGKVITQDIVCMLGEGTEESPYQIDSKKDLCSVYLESDACYELVTDLTFTSSDYDSDGLCPKGWIPIPIFNGVFNGRGHKISNLQGIAGGFVDVNKGVITSVRFMEHRLTYKGVAESFGCVANENFGNITKCYVDVQNEYGYGMQYAGGITGFQGSEGKVSYCQTTGRLYVGGKTRPYGWMEIGGIVGNGAVNGYVLNCYSSLNISVHTSQDIDELRIGGIVGYGRAKNCRYNGDIYMDVRYYDYIYVGTFGCERSDNCYGEMKYTHGNSLGYTYIDENKGDNWYKESELNNVEKFCEDTYQGFDFEETWMITSNGPVPQGIMNADGNCYKKTNYITPKCTEEGSLTCENQLEETYIEVISATGHLAGTANCQGMDVCSVCDALIPNEENPEGGTHNYATTWLSDENFHWKECQSDGCNSIGQKAKHTGGTATPFAQAICSVCGTPYGELDQTTTVYEVCLSACDMTSLESITATLKGTGTYIGGEKVTVSAVKKLGMKFVGWYKVSSDAGAYESKPLCKEYVYSFVLESDTALIAMYQNIGTGKLQVHGAEFKVNNGVTQTIYNYAQEFTIGEHVTLTATGENFAYWINESNKIVTTAREYTFIVAGDVVYTPVYKNAVEGTAYVEFVSGYGQIIQAQNYDSLSEIQMPGPVNKYGFKFLSWSMTAEEIISAIVDGESYICVTPVYEQSPGFFTITTIYDGEVENAEVIEGFEGYKFKEFTAPKIQGRTFSHWSGDESGESVLSTSETYSVYINKNTTVYAIYVDEGINVKKVSTMVTNDISAVRLDETTKSIVVLATRDIIDGYKLIEHGILYSANSNYGMENAEDTMIVGASGVLKGISTSTNETGSYAHTITLTEEQLDIVVYARGYMILTDLEENQITIYGAVVSGNYSSLTQ